MQANNTKKYDNRKKLIISIGVILILIIIISLIIIFKNEVINDNTGTASLTSQEKLSEAEQNASLEKLYDMTEEERITYYCAEFFKLVDTKKYEEAYEILYDEYKENYFPTQASFTEYMKNYFPDDLSLDYTNIERLGDIYVLWVDVTDTLNGSYGHNFSMNVVIRENDFDDFDLSFSRNSAVEEEE